MEVSPLSGFSISYTLTGMYRKKHAAEFEEQERKKAERAAREARAKTLREETRRLERQEEERRRKRRHEKEHRRLTEARTLYESKWKVLLSPPGNGSDTRERELRFQDIPWPVFMLEVGPSDRTNKGKGRAAEVEVTETDLTVEAISTFLLPQQDIPHDTPHDADTTQKERRDRLRETMLRFHPDKFEGRILRYVREPDQERVREAVGRVIRAVTELLATNTK